MLTKKKQAERLAQKGHNKYEYDSDEDTEVRVSIPPLNFNVLFYPKQ